MTQSLIPAGKNLSECMMLYDYMDAIRDQGSRHPPHYIRIAFSHFQLEAREQIPSDKGKFLPLELLIQDQLAK